MSNNFLWNPDVKENRERNRAERVVKRVYGKKPGRNRKIDFYLKKTYYK